MNHTMKSIRIRIPGHWTDGWLYKEHLILWAPNGQMHYIALNQIRTDIVRNADHNTAVIADYLVFRNDWKRSSPFKDLTRLPSVTKALFAPFGESDLIQVNGGGGHLHLSNSEASEGFLVDAEVYGNRIYTASDAGLFETEFNPNYPEAGNPTIQVTDQPAHSVSVKSGTMAVALGTHGLHTRDVGLGNGDLWPHFAENENLNRIDDFSLTASFSSYHLLNYKGESSPSFLRAETQKAAPRNGGQFDNVVIKKHQPAVDLDSDLALVLGPEEGSRTHKRSPAQTDELPNEAHVVGNSEYRLLISRRSQSEVVNVSAFDDKEVELKSNKKYSPDEIDSNLVSAALSTQTLRSGFLLETFDRVGIITERGSYTLMNEPSVRVRSFPRSTRHADCILSVGEDFIELVGFIELRE